MNHRVKTIALITLMSFSLPINGANNRIPISLIKQHFTAIQRCLKNSCLADQIGHEKWIKHINTQAQWNSFNEHYIPQRLEAIQNSNKPLDKKVYEVQQLLQRLYLNHKEYKASVKEWNKLIAHSDVTSVEKKLDIIKTQSIQKPYLHTALKYSLAKDCPEPTNTISITKIIRPALQYQKKNNKK